MSKWAERQEILDREAQKAAVFYVKAKRNKTLAAQNMGVPLRTFMRWVKQDAFMATVDNIEDDLQEELDVSLKRVVQEIATVAYANHKDLYDKEGNLRPIQELPDRVSRTIASTDVETREDGSEVKTRTTKVRCHSKNDALGMLMKYTGGFERDNEQKGKGLETLLERMGGALEQGRKPTD